jgi:maltose-binding protein MalE
MYNADAFKKAGLDDPQKLFAAGKWDQDAFHAAAEALKAKGGVKYGVAFEAWNYDLFAFMGGGTILDKDLNPTIDQGPNNRTYEFLQGLVKDGLAPNPVVASGTFLQYFSSDQLGMYLSGSWWPFYMPKVKFDWQTAPLPSLWGALGTKVEMDALSISAKAKDVDAAWAFVKTVTDAKGLELWTKAATPARKSVLSSPAVAGNPKNAAVAEMLKHGTFTPFTKAGANIDTAATTALSPMWLGKKSAADATSAAASAIKKALANA